MHAIFLRALRLLFTHVYIKTPPRNVVRGYKYLRFARLIKYACVRGPHRPDHAEVHACNFSFFLNEDLRTSEVHAYHFNFSFFK
jgi:hypothetical protein